MHVVLFTQMFAFFRKKRRGDSVESPFTFQIHLRFDKFQDNGVSTRNTYRLVDMLMLADQPMTILVPNAMCLLLCVIVYDSSISSDFLWVSGGED
ncbi:hypothetical protein Droror1_Dr00010099 [Drosera rotundifolia]